MSKLRIIIFELVMISLLSSVALAEAPGVTKGDITVGAINDFSGPAVYTNTQTLYGLMAYFRKAYEEGIYKREIKVVAEDGNYSPAKHLAAGKLLLDRDNVFCFVQTVGTAPTLALNSLLEARKVPLVTPGAQSKTLCDPFKRYIFNPITSVYNQARVCVDVIVSRNSQARIAMICQDDAFGEEGRDGFLDQCKKLGLQPLGVITYQRGAQDLSSHVLKLKSLNPDYVINHSIITQGALILKEAQKLGWKPNWIGMAAVPVRETIKLSGESIDFAGDFLAVKVNYPEDGDSAGAIEFRETIKKYQPKADVDYGAMVGYGGGKIFVEALKRAEAQNDLTREGLIKALETLKDFKTSIFPPITFTSTYHGGPDSCLLVKRQGQSWVPISNEWLKAK